MRRICAWCRADLDGKGNAERGDLITHGICDSCVRHFTANGLVPLRIFLDALEPPVLLMDSAGAILTTNESARRALGIDPADDRGNLPGDILRCANAPLPCGCGKSDKCGACEIRGSVTRTFETGIAMDHIAAYLEVEGPAGREQVMLSISTERVSGSVLLRLDAIEKVGAARQ